MNTLLIIGLVICGAGALLWIVCTAMIAHYDQKLEALDQCTQKIGLTWVVDTSNIKQITSN